MSRPLQVEYINKTKPCVKDHGLKKIMVFLWLFIAIACRGTQGFASSQDYSQYSNSQIVEAIGKAENSIKFPYGIKSINTHSNREYARRICLNSVRNGRTRWIKAGKPEDLIVFIGKKYCPISNCPELNKNWVRNVKFYLEKAEEDENRI